MHHHKKSFDNGSVLECHTSEVDDLVYECGTALGAGPQNKEDFARYTTLINCSNKKWDM
jgi:hypothetical protein